MNAHQASFHQTLHKTGATFAALTALTLVPIVPMARAEVAASSPANRITFAGNLITPRSSHTDTLLLDGRVLISGGWDFKTLIPFAATEFYDPVRNSWTATGSLHEARVFQGTTRLADGRVLTVGGIGPSNHYLTTAEIYDPAKGAWTYAASPVVPHDAFPLLLLSNGKTLAATGLSNGSLTSTAELYDPATNSWTATGNVQHPRSSYTATMLANGKVLLAGGGYGADIQNLVPQAEVYDPATGTFTDTGSLNVPRYDPVATLLQNGRVLITGGVRISGGKEQVLDSTEIYDPVTGVWTQTRSLKVRRLGFTLNLLSNGRVLAIGGEDMTFQVFNSIEQYNPPMQKWTLLRPTLANARAAHTTTTLLDGRLLVAGGADNNGSIPNAELVDTAH